MSGSREASTCTAIHCRLDAITGYWIVQRRNAKGQQIGQTAYCDGKPAAEACVAGYLVSSPLAVVTWAGA